MFERGENLIDSYR